MITIKETTGITMTVMITAEATGIEIQGTIGTANTKKVMIEKGAFRYGGKPLCFLRLPIKWWNLFIAVLCLILQS
jgi:hypothetical protein